MLASIQDGRFAYTTQEKTMSHKILSVLLVVLLCNSIPASAQSKAEIKFKRQILEWGTNQNIKLRLRSKEKLEGRIAEIKPASFVLQFVGVAGQIISREISYSELDKLSKHRDPGQEPGTRTMLIIAAVTVVLTLVITGTNNK